MYIHCSAASVTSQCTCPVSSVTTSFVCAFIECTRVYFHSMEEAKKNMYAFSTTTYTGFQCTIDEETSEKFKGELVINYSFNPPRH